MRREHERKAARRRVVSPPLKPKPLTAQDFRYGERVMAPQFKHWHGIVQGTNWRAPFSGIPGEWLVTVKWSDVPYECAIHPDYLRKIN